jgi:2-oxoglutarate dehydrogenase E2 component (dihydrolipoamide succinyltransferase)
MTVEIKAPAFPESVADGVVSVWHKQPGEAVARDELLVEIETDKVVMEVVAPEPGVLESVVAAEGETITSEALLAVLAPGAAPVADSSATELAAQAPAEPASAESDGTSEAIPMGPAVRALLEEHNLAPSSVAATGKGGRLLKEDVLAHLKRDETVQVTSAPVAQPAPSTIDVTGPTSERIEKRVPMKLRRQYRDEFESAHNGTRLGFMGFFVKAACEALKRFPEVNASIDGSDVVYHGYQDIGVAVSVDEGLVVPVLRDADFMSIADVEAAIASFGNKAREKKLTIEDMTGGTFTVSNGGVFGSLLSTPILNPPQTGILGMHAIQERPIAVDGEVVIQPMMYLALSYDHRLVDGKTAVQFLVTIKGLIEDPARILLQL